MNRLHALSVTFVEHAFEETLTISRMQVAIGDMGRFEKDMIIAYEKPEEVAKAKAQWQTARDAALQQMDHMLVGEEDGDNVVVREMKEQLTAYAAAVEPVTRQLADNGYDTATVANRMLARAHERYADILGSLKRVEGVLKEEAAAMQQEEKDINAQTLLIFGVAVALAALIVVPTTLSNMQSICQPLDEAQRVATAITDGDLTQTVHVSGKDELAALMQALGGMQASLSRIVGEVRNSTDSIGTASEEIASGNQDLSARTEQAASNLQQTAASIDQINSTVRQSADSARQATLDGRGQRRGGRARWPGGEPGGHHHERDQPEQPEDRRHHRRHRRHRFPDQHPGAERRGGSGARR